MFNFLRNKRIFLLMIGFLICIVLIGMTINGREKLTTPEQFLKDTVGAVQRLIYIPLGAVNNFFDDVAELDQLHKENEELRQIAALYTREKVQYNFIEQENERLHQALEFKKHQETLYDYNYLIAQVIAVSNDPNNPTININLGSNHGVEKSMAVVTVDGLVGVVSQVTPFTATVTPITQLNPNSSVISAISATVYGKEGESFGVLTDYNGEDGNIIMSMIDENDPMMREDMVITSGLGNVYPRGLLVGTIESIQVGDFGLTHVAKIKPFAKLDQLTEVFVVQMNNAIDTEDSLTEAETEPTTTEDKEGE